MKPIKIEMTLDEIITIKSFLVANAIREERFIKTLGDPYEVHAKHLATINGFIAKLDEII